MISIKIYGIENAKFKDLETWVLAELDQCAIEYELERVVRFEEIIESGINSIPAVAINNQLIDVGEDPSQGRLRKKISILIRNQMSKNVQK